MAVYLTNGFESGTSGTTISAGNSAPASGQGNAFDIVSAGTGVTLAYSNAEAAHGVLSAKLTEPASAAACNFGWTTSLTGSSVPQCWFRLYCYLPSLPSGTIRVARCFSGAGVLAGAVEITAAGKVVTINAAGTAETTSTLTLPTGAWFRLEGYVTGSATAGQVQVKIFTSSADAITPDETDTTGSALNTTGAIDQVSFGNPSSVGSYTFYIDDAGASDTAYLGPAALSGSHSAALSLAASATGSSERTGSPSASLALTTAAAGLSVRSGQGAAGLALSAVAAGIRRMAGAVTGALSLAASAAGIRPGQAPPPGTVTITPAGPLAAAVSVTPAGPLAGTARITPAGPLAATVTITRA